MFDLVVKEDFLDIKKKLKSTVGCQARAAELVTPELTGCREFKNNKTG